MFYWPPKTPDTLEGWVSIFVNQGYQPSDSREVEPEFEKVAIYVSLSDFDPSHVAYSDGTAWKSKLGRQVDIEHEGLGLLEGDQGDEYGIVERVLKRPIKPNKPAKGRGARIGPTMGTGDDIA
jgi:hypothetical protein